ncbi:MAG: alginate lyase family protein [Sarcina sp.]
MFSDKLYFRVILIIGGKIDTKGCDKLKRKTGYIVLVAIIAIITIGCIIFRRVPIVAVAGTDSTGPATTAYKGLYNKSKLKALTNSTNPIVKKDINALTDSANSLLNITNYPTVVDKTQLIANGETKHDFVSMAPYLWTSSKNKSGYVVKDGVDNPERLDTNKFDSKRLDEMVSDVNTLSLAYAITGNEKYADKAMDFINTWFINTSTNMNPNMKYAQIFVGSNGNTYFSGSSMIAAQPLVKTVNDIYLLEGSTALTKTGLGSLKTWFGTFNTWLLAQNKGGVQGLRINNHGTWLQAEIATFSEFSGATTMGISALEAVGPYSINPQIQSSGKIPSALVRTKSVAYTEYNLEAFITLATMGQQLNVPIYSYVSDNGGSIDKAIDYLNSYLLGKENWPYQNITGKDIHDAPTEGFIPYLAMANSYKANTEYEASIAKYESKLTPIQYLITQSFSN